MTKYSSSSGFPLYNNQRIGAAIFTIDLNSESGPVFNAATRPMIDHDFTRFNFFAYDNSSRTVMFWRSDVSRSPLEEEERLTMYTRAAAPGSTFLQCFLCYVIILLLTSLCFLFLISLLTVSK
jgi:hypothetical protein